MNSILPELWLLIFPYLNAQDLRSVTLTCSSFRFLAQPLLFSTLDVSPFLLAYSTDRPILRPKSYLERSLTRINIYQSPHLIYGVHNCWISPYSRSGFPQRNQLDDLDPNLLINAIVRALPSFPNLTSLAWHCIDFEPEWWDILQSLPIKILWLNSSSIPSPLCPPLSSITHLHIDQWPWEGKPTNYVSMHEESMNGVSTETLQTIIHPLTTESLSIPRIETASRVFRILSQKTHSIRSLNLPLPAILDEHFTSAITSCPQLESISICPPSSDDPRQNFELEPFRPDALPMLTSYDGPYTHVMQFSHRPLKQIKLWGFAQRPTFCDSTSVTEKLRNLGHTTVAESLVSIQVTVYDTTTQFLQVFASFKQLERLTIQSQDNYSKNVPNDPQETHPIMVSKTSHFPCWTPITPVLAFIRDDVQRYLPTNPQIPQILNKDHQFQNRTFQTRTRRRMLHRKPSSKTSLPGKTRNQLRCILDRYLQRDMGPNP